MEEEEEKQLMEADGGMKPRSSEADQIHVNTRRIRNFKISLFGSLTLGKSSGSKSTTAGGGKLILTSKN